MRECRYWVADDGREFDNEEECINYEDGLHYEQLNNSCVCLDSLLRPVDPMKRLDGILVINLKTPEAFEWWKEYNDRIGYDTDGIDSPGVYLYNNDLYKWELVQEKIEYLNDLLKKAEGA